MAKQKVDTEKASTKKGEEKNVPTAPLVREVQELQIPLAELHDHPENMKIYGKTSVALDLIESIRENGVRERLKVAPRTEGGYWIISGHRRAASARIVGLLTVPCEVRIYANDDEMATELLISNQYRVKTPMQFVNEVLYWNQLLCQIKENGVDTTVAGNETVDGDEAGTIVPDIITTLQGLGVDVSGTWRRREMVMKMTGISRYSYPLLIMTFDPKYEADLYDKMKKAGFDSDNISYVKSAYAEVREKVEAGDYTLKQAYKEVQEFTDEINALISGTSPEKTKPEKPAKEPLSAYLKALRTYKGELPRVLSLEIYTEMYGYPDFGNDKMRLEGDSSGNMMVVCPVGDAMVCWTPSVMEALSKQFSEAGKAVEALSDAIKASEPTAPVAGVGV